MMTPGDAYNHCHDIHPIPIQPSTEQGFYQLLIDVIEDHDHTLHPKEHR